MPRSEQEKFAHMWNSTIYSLPPAPDAGFAKGRQSEEESRVTGIIGLGGIGILCATAVGTGTEDRLIAVGRRNQITDTKHDGLHRDGALGEASMPAGRFGAYDGIEAVPKEITFDRVLICVKCYDVAEVSRQLSLRRDVIRPDTEFICFINGWGAHEPLLRLTHTQHIYHGVVTTGVARISTNRASVAVHQRDILIGSLATGASLDPAEILARDLSNGSVPARATPDICRFAWEKLLFNVGVNGMCALNGYSIGELVDAPKCRLKVERLLREAFWVIKRAGYATGHGDVGAYMAKFYRDLVPATAEHKSSMYHDLQRDVPRTEVKWINGAIVKLARENGLGAPESEELIEQVHEMESQRRRAKSPQREDPVRQESEAELKERAS